MKFALYSLIAFQNLTGSKTVYRENLRSKKSEALRNQATSHFRTMEIEKLKVADLRAALGGRGLDTKGTKPILVQRLKVILKKCYNEASGS